MKNQLEEGDLVLCTVTNIEGTIVFVNVEDRNITGTITFPEIAPGRIRNIRDFAFPGKKIVCKILRLRHESLELSLRRVKVNEKNDFNEKIKKERNLVALLKTLLKEKSEEVIAKIKKEEGSLFDFLEAAKEDKKILEKYLEKGVVEKLSTILSEKKSKEITLIKRFGLSSKDSKGINKIKTIVKTSSEGINSEISYIAAGKYIIKLKSKDLKLGDQQLRKILENIEKLAKKENCFFNEEKD